MYKVRYFIKSAEEKYDVEKVKGNSSLYYYGHLEEYQVGRRREGEGNFGEENKEIIWMRKNMKLQGTLYIPLKMYTAIYDNKEK